MNKSYLLVICLLLVPFTGCIEPEEIEITSDPVEDEDNSQIDETKDESDNTEEKELVKGCMNSTANNYNANATEEDNTCDYDLDDDGVLDADEILGCTNSTANNYNAEATEKDNTCDYDLDDDGVLDTEEILGCTDSTAYNYNAEATEEDNTCIFNFQPETRDELKTAVDEWIANSTSANSTYGEINTWDTSLITNMSNLFRNIQTFNDNISTWNVSSVTEMEEMFAFVMAFAWRCFPGHWQRKNPQRLAHLSWL